MLGTRSVGHQECWAPGVLGTRSVGPTLLRPGLACSSIQKRFGLVGTLCLNSDELANPCWFFPLCFVLFLIVNLNLMNISFLVKRFKIVVFCCSHKK